MPEISRFFGIVVQMYYADHEPPHFHVRYSGELIEDWYLARAEAQLKPISATGVNMLKDIVVANALDDYRLHIRFEDGVKGVIDLAPDLSFRGVFEPLTDPDYFARVRVDPELGP